MTYKLYRWDTIDSNFITLIDGKNNFILSYSAKHGNFVSIGNCESGSKLEKISKSILLLSLNLNLIT